MTACSSWWCCCHFSLFLRGTLMQLKRLLVAAKWTVDVGRSQAEVETMRPLLVFYKQSL
uniref:Uncharacterized protein n=1 Tax=Arundo donax TaxID=35708 RepID=A0A0A9BTM1_ARUDO